MRTEKHRQTDEQRDMTKLAVAFSNFAKAPNYCRVFVCLSLCLSVCLSVYLNVSYVLRPTLFIQKDTNSKEVNEKFLLEKLPMTDTEFSVLKIEAQHVVLEENPNQSHF